MRLVKILIFIFSVSAAAQELNPQKVKELQERLQEYQDKQKEEFEEFMRQKRENAEEDDAGGDVPVFQSPPSAKQKASVVGGFTQSQSGPINSKELEKKVEGRIKDPFMLPSHLYLTVKKKLSEVEGEGYVDESVEPQRRWALKHYNLVAIIWNVKNPKAMILDKNKTLHMFYVGDGIGNTGGVITAIDNGRVTVRDSDTDVVLKMINKDK